MNTQKLRKQFEEEYNKLKKKYHKRTDWIPRLSALMDSIYFAWKEELLSAIRDSEQNDNRKEKTTILSEGDANEK